MTEIFKSANEGPMNEEEINMEDFFNSGRQIK